MKAVIMAGGKGTRLSSYTKEIPKPMILIGGKPVLEHQVMNLKANGIEEITIIIGYLGNVIKGYFGDGVKFGVNINYIEEDEPLGTAGALFYLKDIIKEDFFLLFGDIMLNIDWRRFYEFHKQKNGWITLLAHPNSHPFDSDLLQYNHDFLVTNWWRKDKERPEVYNNLVNAGVYVVSPSVIEEITKLEKKDFEKNVVLSYILQGKVFAYRSTEYVKDMGTPERLKVVEEDYNRGLIEKKCYINKQRCIFLDRDGTINEYRGLIKNKDEFELIEQADSAINKINTSKYLCIVVTNQPVIARGDCSIEELEEIHKKLETDLGVRGAYVDDLFYCPHHPDRGYVGEIQKLKIQCKCRKPEIGLLLMAKEKYNIDLQESWLIGDTTRDILTGKNAGCRTILVKTGEGGGDGKFDVDPDFICEDILEAVNLILKNFN